MNQQLVKVDPKEYGLDAGKAKDIERAFSPKIAERDGLVKVYSRIISEKITQDLVVEAKAVRLKLVKVRTGFSEIHKTQKVFFRAAGLFVDAWKNKETLPVVQMEEKLSEIEDYYPKIERAKLDAVEKSRIGKLQKYQIETEHYDLREMSDAGWDQLLKSSGIAYDIRLAEEKKLEKDRIAEENRREKEAEKNRKENIRLKKDADKQEAARLREKFKQEKVLLKERLKRKKIQDQLDKQAEEVRILKEKEAEEDRIRKEKEDLAASAPDRLKLEKLANDIATMKMPDVKNKKAKETINGVVNLLQKTSNFIKQRGEKI